MILTTKKRGHSSVTLPAKSDRGIAVLRAMNAYMARRDVALRTVWEQERLDPLDETSPMIKDVIPYGTLLAQANASRWGARRTAMWTQIENDALRALQSDLTQARIRELGMLNAAADVLRNNIFGVPDPEDPTTMKIAPAKPRSLEGLINALVRLDAHMQAKREGIADVMLDAADRLAQTRDVIDSDEQAVLPSVDDGFSDDDVREFAKYMAKKRARESSAIMARRRGITPPDEEE